MFIGGNDVLGYAVSGGSNDDILTDAASFQGAYSVVISNNEFNICKWSSYGYPIFSWTLFQAVPYNAIPLTAQGDVDALNAAYAAYNGGLQQAA